MFIIKFILFLFLFFLLAVFYVAFKLYWKFRQLTGQMRQQAEEPTFQHTAQGGHRQSDGSVVIDNRSAHGKSRRIVDDDEGEYVDYEEQAD